MFYAVLISSKLATRPETTNYITKKQTDATRPSDSCCSIHLGHPCWIPSPHFSKFVSPWSSWYFPPF